MNEGRGVLDLKTFFRIPQSFLQVRPKRHDIVKVRELGVALDGFLCEGDRFGDAGADDKILEVQHVSEVLFATPAPLTDLFGTKGQCVGPHREWKTGADEFRSSRPLVYGLEAALVDRELVAGDERCEGDSKLIEIAVMHTLYHCFLVLRDRKECHGRLAACGTIVDDKVGKVCRQATLHRGHECSGIIEDFRIRRRLV